MGLKMILVIIEAPKLPLNSIGITDGYRNDYSNRCTRAVFMWKTQKSREEMHVSLERV